SVDADPATRAALARARRCPPPFDRARLLRVRGRRRRIPPRPAARAPFVALRSHGARRRRECGFARFPPGGRLCHRTRASLRSPRNRRPAARGDTLALATTESSRSRLPSTAPRSSFVRQRVIDRPFRVAALQGFTPQVTQRIEPPRYRGDGEVLDTQRSLQIAPSERRRHRRPLTLAHGVRARDALS